MPARSRIIRNTVSSACAATAAVTAIRSFRRAREVAPTARAWQREVQCLGDERGVSIEVHRSPPGTSKRNKIETRLVSFISLSRSSARIGRQAFDRPRRARRSDRRRPTGRGSKGHGEGTENKYPEGSVDLGRREWPCPDRALGLKPGSPLQP
jgi:Rhodopirellula transposase DDE domain